MKSQLRTLQAPLLAMLTCFAFVPAYAGDLQIGNVLTLHVAYDDLNLESDQGAKTLYRRIVTAAERVCPLHHQGDLAATSHATTCRRQAIEHAVGEVNSPRLAALHSMRASG